MKYIYIDMNMFLVDFSLAILFIHLEHLIF